MGRRGLRSGKAGSSTTTLRGPVTDQSELHGLLAKIRDLGAPLISVAPINADSNHEHHL